MSAPVTTGSLRSPSSGLGGTVSGRVGSQDSQPIERRQFQMKSCLGRGGFGEVYRATMTSAGGVRTEVAVKVLHAEVDPNSQAVQRLRDEGRMLGAVRHPSVLRVYDLVVLDGRVALITEYVEGQDYDKLITSPIGTAQRADPLPARAVMEVIAKVADALDAAYNAPMPMAPEGPTGATPKLHLVHRDVKPPNIRIGRHGEVKLLDFGIAHAANPDREAHTETNAMLGSYLYMAPERFLENVETGPAVDIYSLGLTLFEGLTGFRLFGEMTLKEMYLLILDEGKYATYVRKALERIPAEIPNEVVTLLQRTLDLDPTKRPDHKLLAKTSYELADRLPGKTLERWARSRQWPPPRAVRGMLDGIIITETSFSKSGKVVATAARTAESLPAAIDEGPGFLRTATATLERPGVVMGVGFGLFGLMAVLAAGLGVTLLGIILVIAAHNTSGGEQGLAPIEPPITVSPPIEMPPTPATPIAVEPAPPRPHHDPVASPAPVAPDPVVVAPAPPTPAPVRPTPAPAARDDAPAIVTVSGGVNVKFIGKNGEFPAGRVPAGTYEIRAFLHDTWQTQDEKLYVTPGDKVTVECSTTKERCTPQ